MYTNANNTSDFLLKLNQSTTPEEFCAVLIFLPVGDDAAVKMSLSLILLMLFCLWFLDYKPSPYGLAVTLHDKAAKHWM